MIWSENFFGKELQLQSKVRQKTSCHPRETPQMLVPKFFSYQYASSWLCSRLLSHSNHLWAWPKLSNVLVYNPRHISAVTRKWTSRRLSGQKVVRTEDELVLQISSKLWESPIKYPCLIISCFLKVPQSAPVGGPLLWMVRNKNEPSCSPFSRLFVDSILETFFFQQYC